MMSSKISKFELLPNVLILLLLSGIIRERCPIGMERKWYESVQYWTRYMTWHLTQLTRSPLDFRGKLLTSCISGMNCSIGMERKGYESIRCWTRYMILTIEPTNDLDVGCSRFNFEITVFLFNGSCFIWNFWSKGLKYECNDCKWQHGKPWKYLCIFFHQGCGGGEWGWGWGWVERGYPRLLCSQPGVGITKGPFANFPVSKFSILQKYLFNYFNHIHVKQVSPQLRRHLPNISVIFFTERVFWRFWKIRKITEWRKLA